MSDSGEFLFLAKGESNVTLLARGSFSFCETCAWFLGHMVPGPHGWRLRTPDTYTIVRAEAAT